MKAGVTMNLKADENGNGKHIVMGILRIVTSVSYKSKYKL